MNTRIIVRLHQRLCSVLQNKFWAGYVGKNCFYPYYLMDEHVLLYVKFLFLLLCCLCEQSFDAMVL